MRVGRLAFNLCHEFFSPRGENPPQPPDLLWITGRKMKKTCMKF